MNIFNRLNIWWTTVTTITATAGTAATDAIAVTYFAKVNQDYTKTTSDTQERTVKILKQVFTGQTHFLSLNSITAPNTVNMRMKIALTYDNDDCSFIHYSVTYSQLQLRVESRPKAELATVQLIEARLLKRFRIQNSFQWRRNISHSFVQFMLLKTYVFLSVITSQWNSKW